MAQELVAGSLSFGSLTGRSSLPTMRRFGFPAFRIGRPQSAIKLFKHPLAVTGIQAPHLFALSQHFTGSGGVVTIAFQLGDDCSLVGDVLFALSHMPLGRAELVSFGHMSHAGTITQPQAPMITAANCSAVDPRMIGNPQLAQKRPLRAHLLFVSLAPID
jgi:hypothetical protein